MKRKLFLGFSVLLVLGFFPTGLYAQSSSNEQKLVGTWTVFIVDWEGGGRVGSIWTFNPNGTYSIDGGQPEIYGATASKIYIKERGGLWNFYLSTDGKTLILEYPGNSNMVTVLRKNT